MAEVSIFWPTGTTGDGASTYTDTQLFSWLRRTFNSDMSTDRGPLKGYNNELSVTAGSGKVTVGTGAAYVYGIPYENDAALDVTIPTPTSNTRIDRIVLRASWTAKTVRITRIAGTEGAGAPAITQSPGSVYDVKLAQVRVTTSGGITVTDERQFCRFATEISTLNLADQAVTDTKLADGAVTSSKIADGAVDTAQLVDSAVTSAKINSGAISDAHISATAAIAQSKISNTTRAIDADKVDGYHASDFAPVGYITNQQQSHSIEYNTNWSIPSSWTDALVLTVTVGQPCDLFIYATFGVSPSQSSQYDMRVIVDSTTMDSFSHTHGAVYGTFNAHWYFGTAGAGLHTIRLQLEAAPGNQTCINRRLSVIVIPR